MLSWKRLSMDKIYTVLLHLKTEKLQIGVIFVSPKQVWPRFGPSGCESWIVMLSLYIFFNSSNTKNCSIWGRLFRSSDALMRISGLVGNVSRFGCNVCLCSFSCTLSKKAHQNSILMYILRISGLLENMMRFYYAYSLLVLVLISYTPLLILF